ncbi:MAG: hypothetical protein ACU0BB_17595 [Paracoccaceae bacterium]
MIKPVLIALIVTGAGGLWWWVDHMRKQATKEFEALYERPLSAPDGPLRVFHIGHSLVGRDMPMMLEQMATASIGPGHDHQSQLGWGTSLKEHWEPDLAINGFDSENAHSRFRSANDAIASSEYDAIILTEMVEIRDAIKYHDSGKYVSLWSDLARDKSAKTRVYLYETWHNLDDPDGWLERLDLDLSRYWEQKLLRATRTKDGQYPVFLIPAGQVMSRFARELQERGSVGDLTSIEDLFARKPDGTLDTIHLNDLGNYLVALTHYAVLYQRAPLGLPRQLNRADGTPAVAPDAETAELMQSTVWEVVTSLPKTGLSL